MKKIAIIALLISLGFILIPQISFAEPIKLNIDIPGTTNGTVEDLGDYIRIFYEFFVTSAGILAAAMMVIGGYKWITAAGNPSIISGAKEQIMSAIFGLVLALTSFFILNTLNPSITALTPLTIPVVQELLDGEIAGRPCDFDAEINETAHEPIRCGTTKVINAESGEKCVGVWNKDSDNFCRIETTPGTTPVVRAYEVGELTMQNHNVTSQTTFDVKNDESKDCGIVYWSVTGIDASGSYMVGSVCSDMTIPDGDAQAERCVMEGEFGNFTSDETVCPGITYPVQHDNGTIIPAQEARAACGHVTNMKCAE